MFKNQQFVFLNPLNFSAGFSSVFAVPFSVLSCCTIKPRANTLSKYFASSIPFFTTWYIPKARLSAFAHGIPVEDRMFALIGLIVFIIIVFILGLQAVKICHGKPCKKLTNRITSHKQ